MSFHFYFNPDMKKILLLTVLTFSFGSMIAQNKGYWQQHVDYKMDVTMDVKNYQYKGKQELVYTNNSQDTLKKVYYHLFNNAFQPGSEMDARIQTIKDPDGRMVNKVVVAGKEVKESRIKTLKPTEIGFLKSQMCVCPGREVRGFCIFGETSSNSYSAKPFQPVTFWPAYTLRWPPAAPARACSPLVPPSRIGSQAGWSVFLPRQTTVTTRRPEPTGFSAWKNDTCFMPCIRRVDAHRGKASAALGHT